MGLSALEAAMQEAIPDGKLIPFVDLAF